MILYADDDQDDRVIFEEIVEQLQKTVETFPSGHDMLRFLATAERKPEMIFLDLNMPSLKGSEVVKIVRSNSAWDEVPLVMLTTSDDPGSIEETFKLGANFFVTKRGDFIRYLNSIRFVIEGSWMQSSKSIKNFVYTD